jgi:methionyl aminopeptidase
MCYVDNSHRRLLQQANINNNNNNVGHSGVNLNNNNNNIGNSGANLNNIGCAIQDHAHKHGFSVVRDYCGHGIGKVFHAEPSVLHYKSPSEKIIMQEGMFFTIEPMINAGSFESLLSKHDGWTVTTRDKSLSAQFEHTIAVTENGFEIFTLSPKGLDFPPYKL